MRTHSSLLSVYRSASIITALPFSSQSTAHGRSFVSALHGCRQQRIGANRFELRYGHLPAAVCHQLHVPGLFHPATIPNHRLQPMSNVQVQVNCNPPPGTPLPLGANPIHCVVTTANGEFIAACDFTMLLSATLCLRSSIAPATFLSALVRGPLAGRRFGIPRRPLLTTAGASPSPVCPPREACFPVAPRR